jgi:hypothetical protein
LLSYREQIAEKRIVNILKKHGIATMRALEQKISDAGPYNQRIDPHILTTVRNRLAQEGRVIKINNLASWYHLNDTPKKLYRHALKSSSLSTKSYRKMVYNSKLIKPHKSVFIKTFL